MNPIFYGVEFAAGLFVGMLLLLEFGRRLAIRHLAKDPERPAGLGAAEAAVFSLLGLLIAFTFSGAATRFDGRRELIVQEANNIGTAYLRIDLLPGPVQPVLRDLLRRYLDSRLESYKDPSNRTATNEARERSAKLQGEIWSIAVAACRDSGSQAAHMLLLPALNDMFDITTTRIQATRIHQPLIIFGMLGVLALTASLLAGYGMASSKSRSWLHTLGFAAALALTVYVIVDIEYPRLGLISVDAADQVLVELRESMK